MNIRKRPLTDAEFDRLLGRWLGGGVELGADGIAERALQIVANTPQDGTRAEFARAPRAWAAAIGVALLVGVGILSGTRLVGDDASPMPMPSGNESEALRPSQEPRPSDSARPVATDLRIDLPDGWSFDGDAVGGWVNPLLKASIRVRAGDASQPHLFCTETLAGRCGDGTPASPCQEDGSSYCKQVTIADLTALRRVLTAENPPIRETTRRSTTVDGAVAWLIESTQAFDQGRRQLQKTYVLFIHDGRPFALVFKTTAISPPAGWVDRIVASLRFE